jgi:hypothetical protein
MMRRAWIDSAEELAVVQQCELAGVSRATFYAQAVPPSINELDRLHSRLIDEEYTRHPFYGSRRMVVFLKTLGHDVNRKRVRRLMRDMGLSGMAPGSVRLRRRTNCTVEVRVGASQDSVAEGNCAIVRWGGEQPEANWRSEAQANLIRPGVTTSLRIRGEVWKALYYAEFGVQSDRQVTLVFGVGTLGSLCEISRETCRRGEGDRSQNLRSTARRKSSQGEMDLETAIDIGEELSCLTLAEVVGKARKNRTRVREGR